MERPNFQPWHELTILSVIGMEIAWVSLWFRIFSRTGGVISYWRALAVLGGMLAGAYALAHLLNVLRLRINLRRGLLAILLISGVFLGSKTLLYPGQAVGAGEILRRTVLIFDLPSGVIPSEFAVALALIWAWGRGVYLAGREVDASLVRRSFYTGAGMLFAYGLIAPATGETSGRAALSVLVLLAFGDERGAHLRAGTILGTASRPPSTGSGWLGFCRPCWVWSEWRPWQPNSWIGKSPPWWHSPWAGWSGWCCWRQPC